MRLIRSLSGLILILFLFGTLFVLAIAQDEPQEEDASLEGLAVLQENIGIYMSLSYEIMFQADTTVTIAVHSRSNSLDPMLVVDDPDGEILSENDNHASVYTSLDTYDALIENLPIPVTGNYTIHVQNQFWSMGLVDLIIIENDIVPLPDVLRAVAEGSFIPGSSLLSLPRRTTGPCTARGGPIPANLRDAPALSGEPVRLLYSDEDLAVSGFYDRGEDGFTWYLVANYLWARADAIILEGDCSNLNEY